MYAYMNIIRALFQRLCFITRGVYFCVLMIALVLIFGSRRRLLVMARISLSKDGQLFPTGAIKI